jgi:hypothetical protein
LIASSSSYLADFSIADPAAAPKLPLTPEMFAFIDQAMAADAP